MFLVNSQESDDVDMSEMVESSDGSLSDKYTFISPVTYYTVQIILFILWYRSLRGRVVLKHRIRT